MPKIFFTSDLHFGHTNVLNFDNRPFATVDEMNAEIVRRWNEKVSKDDTVYVLGDMIWKKSAKDAANVIRSLNGKIVLIKGNHDRFVKNEGARKALADVKEADDICVTLEDG
jgi:calcineurin-like phosphoesterase family protein